MDDNQQLREEMKAVGVLIGTLLAKANIPDEEKRSWLALLPEMTIEQIDRLVIILGAHVAIDPKETEELKVKMKAIKEKYDKQRVDLNKQTVDKLEKINKEVG